MNWSGLIPLHQSALHDDLCYYTSFLWKKIVFRIHKEVKLFYEKKTLYRSLCVKRFLDKMFQFENQQPYNINFIQT